MVPRTVYGVTIGRTELRGSEPADAALLASTQLFAGVDADTLRRVADSCTSRTFGRGQYLWYEGDEGERLVVVASGLLKVVVTSDRGDEIVLSTAGPGHTLGELALLDGGPRSASVVAVEQTSVLLLGRATVLDLMSHHPTVLDAVLRSLGALVRRLTEQTGDLVFLDLGGRLAKVLLRLAADRPAGRDGRVVLDRALSQSDLAAMVGATRPAVNRVLQLLVARGLIAVDGRVIELLDLPGLRRRAGM